jgi:hypothetical protein
MELLRLILCFMQGKIPGLFSFLNLVNNVVVGAVAEIFHLPVSVVLVAGLVLAILCGLLAYRFVKAFLAFVAADFGFFVGAQIYFSVQTETMPDWVSYLFGLVVAVVFFWLAYGRASYVWYVIVAMLGYCATRFYLLDNLWVAIGGAFLLAMLSIAFFRILYIAFTSLACGVLCMSFVSALLPAGVYNPLLLYPRNVIFWGCVLILSILFITAQFWINARYQKKRA